MSGGLFIKENVIVNIFKNIKQYRMEVQVGIFLRQNFTQFSYI